MVGIAGFVELNKWEWSGGSIMDASINGEYRENGERSVGCVVSGFVASTRGFGRKEVLF